MINDTNIEQSTEENVFFGLGSSDGTPFKKWLSDLFMFCQCSQH
jgi:hypothetical protein